MQDGFFLQSVKETLEGRGEEVVSSWLHKSSLKPYHENIEASKAEAETIVREVLSADIFVLISDEAGTDMYVELGIALSKYEQDPRSIRIYVVGPHATRSLMHLHPGIQHKENISEVTK